MTKKLEKHHKSDMPQGTHPKQHKSRVWIWIVGVIALAGISLLLYPTAENWLYHRGVAAQKQDFMNRSAKASGQDGLPYDDLYQFLKSENENMYLTGQSGLVDAFSYQTRGIDLSAYGIEDDCIGYIEIPSIGIQLPIYLGANTDNMKKGAVHLTQTSYPIGGPNTNAVIAAHRTVVRDMFRNIDKIQIGDVVYITNFRERLTYKAVEIKIIDPTDVNQIKIQEGRDLVTLVSCHPPGTTNQRYVVYCERVSDGLDTTATDSQPTE